MPVDQALLGSGDYRKKQDKWGPCPHADMPSYNSLYLPVKIAAVAQSVLQPECPSDPLEEDSQRQAAEEW